MAIHVQRSDTGIDYTIYDAASAKALDGGVLDDTGQLLSAAALTVCKLHNIGDAAPIRLAPLELLNGLQEANELLLGADEQITGVEATSTADSLPDLPQLEQGYPIPDPPWILHRCINSAIRTETPCCRSPKSAPEICFCRMFRFLC